MMFYLSFGWEDWTTTDTYLAVSNILLSLIAIPFARKAGRDFAAKYPDRRPFTWGFWNGYMVMSTGIASMLIYVPSPEFPLDEKIGSIIYLGLYAWLGWRVLSRRRHAFVWATILSVEWLLWIINGIYMRNRWGEFKTEHPPKDPRGHHRVGK